MKKHLKTIVFYLLLIGVIIALVATIFRGTENEVLVLEDVVTYFEQDAVQSFVIDENYNLTLTVGKTDENGVPVLDENGKLTELAEKSYRLQSLGLFQEYCGEYVKTNANLETYDILPEAVTPWYVSLLPYAIILVVFVGI